MPPAQAVLPRDSGNPFAVHAKPPGAEGRGSIAQPVTVSHLLVVLCSDKGTQPVLNTGTLYQ